MTGLVEEDQERVTTSLELDHELFHNALKVSVLHEDCVRPQQRKKLPACTVMCDALAFSEFRV